MKTDIQNIFAQGPLLISKRLFLFTLAISFLYRLIFGVTFGDLSVFSNFQDFLYSCYLALKFDLRLAVLVAAPFFLLWPISKILKKSLYLSFFFYFYILIYLTLCISFILDIIHFDYLGTRLTFSSMRFLDNFDISIQVAIDAYPVFWIGLFFILFLLFLFFALKKIFFSEVKIKQLSTVQYFGLYFSISFLMALGVYGKLAPPPALRWADIYLVKNSFLRQATLNPLLYFYDSSQWNSVSYDINLVKKIYPHLKKVLGLPDDEKNLSFSRLITATPQGSLDSKTNVIVIIMESLSKHLTSLTNPMNSTPYLKKIAKNGVYFNNFFTSTMGTARGVFSTITSVPDPNFGRKGTASRNNDLPEQNSAINALQKHKKFYFLGGSLNWAQMRGVIRKSILGVNIYEEGSYERPNTDVWGLSDLDLVIEADKVFKKTKAPFVGILQFSSFHSPFSIPKDKKEFKLEKHSLEVLKKNGFRHLKEYNSLRFSDYSLNYLMKLAKKSKYFENTLFVILGDHGGEVRGEAPDVPQYIKDFKLGYSMTPLIFYAPKKIRPKIYSKFALQVDVLPSVVAALGKSFVATGFGVNLFDEKLEREYVYTQNSSYLFLVEKKQVFKYHIEAKKVLKYSTLLPYQNIDINNAQKTVQLKNKIVQIHEAMKYLLFKNKK